MSDEYYSMRAALLLRRGSHTQHPFPGGVSSVVDAILDAQSLRQSSETVQSTTSTNGSRRLGEELRAPMHQQALRRRFTSAIAALFL